MKRMDEEVVKRLAKFIVRFCFRENTILEKLHSRITDAEMRELMMASVDNCSGVLCLLFGATGPLPPEAEVMQGYLEMMTGTGDLVKALRSRYFNPTWAEPGTRRSPPNFPKL